MSAFRRRLVDRRRWQYGRWITDAGNPITLTYLEQEKIAAAALVSNLLRRLLERRSDV